MLCTLVRHLRTLQIPIGNRYVRVSRLVASYDNAFGVGEVADSGVLQAIELVCVGEAESFPDTYSFLPKAVHRYLLTARPYMLAKEIVLRWVAEHALLDHHLQ